MIKFAGLLLNPAAIRQRKQQFRQAQEFVDKTVLDYCEPYVPVQTGKLKESGRTGTVIGSGTVKYTAPYAKPRYYVGKSKGGLRGKYWFSRMKSDKKEQIFSKTRSKFK